MLSAPGRGSFFLFFPHLSSLMPCLDSCPGVLPALSLHLLWLLMFPASGPALLCAQGDFGTLFTQGHLPRQPELADFVQGLVSPVPAEPVGTGTLLGSPRAQGTRGPGQMWPRQGQGRWPCPAEPMGHSWQGHRAAGGAWLVLWELTAQAGAQTLRALRRRRRRERVRAGKAGNVPTVQPWAAAFRIRPQLCCRRVWGRGRAAGAGPWASPGCHGSATELTGPWALRVTGHSALLAAHRTGHCSWNVPRAGMLGLPLFCPTARNAGGPLVLPHPQQLCQLLVGRERVNHRAAIPEYPEI